MPHVLIIKWDPFFGEIKLDAKIYGDFEGFPLRMLHCLGWCHTVDGRNPKQPPGTVLKPCNNGINYQPQLVQDFFHQQYNSLRGPLWVTHRSGIKDLFEPRGGW